MTTLEVKLVYESDKVPYSVGRACFELDDMPPELSDRLEHGDIWSDAYIPVPFSGDRLRVVYTWLGKSRRIAELD